jgi:hypothetical protein
VRLDRSGLTQRLSRREATDPLLSKSARESARKGRKRGTANSRELQTQKPLRALRGRSLSSHLPREGAGSYSGYIFQDGRYKPVYRVIRNGLPEQVPYRYGASRGTWTYRNLDLEAIAAADREASGRRAQPRYPALAAALAERARKQPDPVRVTGQPEPRARRIRPEDLARIRGTAA